MCSDLQPAHSAAVVPPDVAGKVMLASVKWRRLDRIAVRTDAASLRHHAGHRYPNQPTRLTYPTDPISTRSPTPAGSSASTTRRHDPAVARITHHARVARG